MIHHDEYKQDNLSIVLVDDDDIIREIIRVYLENRYDVDDFSNAPDALEFLKTHNADLILSDINMPGMNGLELRDALNDFTHLEAVPFIFLTGSLDDTLKNKAKALGIDDFIRKPVQKDDLLNTVEPILLRRAQVATALGRMLDVQIGRASCRERV